MAGGFLLCVSLVLCSLATKLFHVYLALGIVGGRSIKIVYSVLSLLCVHRFECRDAVSWSLSLLNIDDQKLKVLDLSFHHSARKA